MRVCVRALVPHSNFGSMYFGLENTVTAPWVFSVSASDLPKLDKPASNFMHAASMPRVTSTLRFSNFSKPSSLYYFHTDCSAGCWALAACSNYFTIFMSIWTDMEVAVIYIPGLICVPSLTLYKHN